MDGVTSEQSPQLPTVVFYASIKSFAHLQTLFTYLMFSSSTFYGRRYSPDQNVKVEKSKDLLL